MKHTTSTIGAVAALVCSVSLAQAQTAAPCTIVSPHTVCVVTVLNSTGTHAGGHACKYFQLGSSAWYALDPADAGYVGMLQDVSNSYALGDAAGPFAANYVSAVSGICDGTTPLIYQTQLGTVTQ